MANKPKGQMMPGAARAAKSKEGDALLLEQIADLKAENDRLSRFHDDLNEKSKYVADLMQTYESARKVASTHKGELEAAYEELRQLAGNGKSHPSLFDGKGNAKDPKAPPRLWLPKIAKQDDSQSKSSEASPDATPAVANKIDAELPFALAPKSLTRKQISDLMNTYSGALVGDLSFGVPGFKPVRLDAPPIKIDGALWIATSGPLEGSRDEPSKIGWFTMRKVERVGSDAKPEPGTFFVAGSSYRVSSKTVDWRRSTK